METYNFVCDDEEIKRVLKSVFGFDSFRPSQLEIVKACLNQNDVLVMIPTGGGKSLCYQLPAILSKKVTFIVSPLLSLMQDQIDSLTARGVPCCQINSSVDNTEVNKIMDSLTNGDADAPRIIYTTPETLQSRQRIKSALDQLVRDRQIDRFVIDEVHCLSQWGHDFRESYLYLQELRRLYPMVPCTALTASATEMVEKDIIYLLNMTGITHQVKKFKQSFFRANLKINVIERTTTGKEHVTEVIRNMHRGQCGIVYCLSRKRTEETSVHLRTLGIKAAYYHAGMEPEKRAEAQKGWQSGKIDVICATIAFGMGIDKSNVRFVIHQEMPQSIAEYYQAIGRAGRDGATSHCYLFYHVSDKIILDKMMADSPPKRKLLLDMMNFIENDFICRHRLLCCEFGELDLADCETSCDTCKNRKDMEEVDVTPFCITICKTILELSDKATLGYVCQVVRNNVESPVLPNLEKLESFSNKQIHMLVQLLLIEGYLCIDVVRNKSNQWTQKLKVYSKYKKLEANDSKIMMKTPTPSQWNLTEIKQVAFQCPFDTVEKVEVNSHPLYAKLQRERIMLAKRANSTPLYRIASNKSLDDMVKMMPTTMEDLQLCQGIGKERAKKYGKNFLKIIKEYKKGNCKPESPKKKPRCFFVESTIE